MDDQINQQQPRSTDVISQTAPANNSPDPPVSIDREFPQNNTPTSDNPPKKRESGIFSFILVLVAAVVAVQVINAFVFQSYRVYGQSMHPTLETGDRLIISKIGKTAARIRQKNFQPKRGEVVVFTDPQDTDMQLIKRVIGLPGERVVVKDSKITVYNQQYPKGFNPDDAPYGKDLPPTSGNTDIKVPEGHIFVSGDNRIGGNSLDSRNQLGTVPEELIIGTLSLRFAPINTAHFF